MVGLPRSKRFVLETQRSAGRCGVATCQHPFLHFSFCCTCSPCPPYYFLWFLPREGLLEALSLFVIFPTTPSPSTNSHCPDSSSFLKPSKNSENVLATVTPSPSSTSHSVTGHPFAWASVTCRCKQEGEIMVHAFFGEGGE